MEMHQVRYFLAVAEHLNFTRAAERLHVAQPSLTRAIQKLEGELGGQLFRRERANTHLTELGRMMLPHLQATLGAADAARRHAQSFHKQETGEIRLGACSTVSAAVAFRLLTAVSAEIAALNLLVDVAPFGVVEDRLLAGELDAAILAPVDGVPDRFDIYPVDEHGYVVAFAPGHRFEARQEMTLEALDGEPLVVRTGCVHEAVLADTMRARGITRLERHRSGDERWLAGLVRIGLGCIIVPEVVALAQDLPFRPLTDLPSVHGTVLATVAGRRRSPALAAVVRHVKIGRAPARVSAPPEIDDPA